MRALTAPAPEPEIADHNDGCGQRTKYGAVLARIDDVLDVPVDEAAVVDIAVSLAVERLLEAGQRAREPYGHGPDAPGQGR